jgi:hypothetical protein
MSAGWAAVAAETTSEQHRTTAQRVERMVHRYQAVRSYRPPAREPFDVYCRYRALLFDHEP